MNRGLTSAVAVYKTDVSDPGLASRILDELHKSIPGCDASFDLEDCDNVLRVEYTAEKSPGSIVEKIVKTHGGELYPLPLFFTKPNNNLSRVAKGSFTPRLSQNRT
jgi:hypothetical protein